MSQSYHIQSVCRISENLIEVDGNQVFASQSEDFSAFAKEAYRALGINYPKFFKMDNLSKLAFLGSELLLKDEKANSEGEKDIALVFSNSASSLDTDLKHQESISDHQNYFPSPAVFVYTLPNICLGEISIRHNLKSENSFFIFAAFNQQFTDSYAEILLKTGKASKVLCAWVDLLKDKYTAHLYLMSAIN